MVPRPFPHCRLQHPLTRSLARVSCVSCVARVSCGVCVRGGAMPVAGAFSAGGLWAGAVKAISHMFLQEYVFAPHRHLRRGARYGAVFFPSFHITIIIAIPAITSLFLVPLHATHTTQRADESFEAYDPIAPIKQGYIYSNPHH